MYFLDFSLSVFVLTYIGVANFLCLLDYTPGASGAAAGAASGAAGAATSRCASGAGKEIAAKNTTIQNTFSSTSGKGLVGFGAYILNSLRSDGRPSFKI